MSALAGDEVAALDPEELEQQVKVESDGGSADVTKDELYQRAQELDLPGRSQMTKDELAKALERTDA